MSQMASTETDDRYDYPTDTDNEDTATMRHTQDRTLDPTDRNAVGRWLLGTNSLGQGLIGT